MPVDSQNKEYVKAKSLWKKCADCIEGQDAIHNAGKTYLPKLSSHSETEYKAFKSRALFYNATGRTLDGMTGLIFRKEVSITQQEASKAYSENINGNGMSIHTFAEKLVDMLIAYGRVGTLVDYPNIDTTSQKTVKQVESLGFKPYATIYSPFSIINWDELSQGVIAKVVIAEEIEITDPKDEFKKAIDYTWRVLDLVDGFYRARRFRKNGAGKDEQIGGDYYPLMNGARMNFIPFYICGTNGLGASVQKPPLIDLVNVNLSHYRSTADYEHGLHFTALPTPYATGFAPQEIEGKAPASLTIGSESFLTFPNEMTQVGYLEFQGLGLTQVKDALTEKEAKMASLGARMLAPEKQAVETAETATIHRSGENSVLASISKAGSMILTKTYNTLLQWAGSSDKAAVALNTDFIASKLSAQELTALLGAVQAGKISNETFFWNLQQGELVAPSLTYEEEQAKIESQPPPLGMI